jgi:hypothetical protein
MGLEIISYMERRRNIESNILLTFLPSTEERLALDRLSLMGTAGVQLRLTRLALARESRESGDWRNTGDASATKAGRLDSHGLPHNGAAVGQDLQLRDSPAARRSLRTCVGSRRHRPQGSNGCILHEGAHGLGLTKDRIHGGQRFQWG